MNRYEALSGTKKVRENTAFKAKKMYMGNWEEKAFRGVGKVYPKALQDMFAHHSLKELNHGALPPYVEESGLNTGEKTVKC